MNRLTEFWNPLPEPEVERNYFVIEAFFGAWAVSREVAADLERQLDHRPAPRWVVFRDVAGARHRVLADRVSRISESTVEQRAAFRAFRRALREEEKADRRSWEDDEE
jgi:hypothetical protein